MSDLYIISKQFLNSDNQTIVCLIDPNDRAKGTAILTIVVTSFVLSCLVFVTTSIQAYIVSKRVPLDEGIMIVDIVEEGRPSRAFDRQDTLVPCGPNGEVPSQENTLTDETDLYLPLSPEAQEMYKESKPRRHSSIFPAITEEYQNQEEGESFGFGNNSSRPSWSSNYNYPQRGVGIRVSASSAIAKKRKSSDNLLRVPGDHNTLHRTGSQEVVDKFSEYLFSDRDPNLLSPNYDDTSRRPSASSSGKRKISVDHLLSALRQDPPNSAKTQRRRESTPIHGSPIVQNEKSLKRSITTTELNQDQQPCSSPLESSNEPSPKGQLRPKILRLISGFEKYATLTSRNFSFDLTDSNQPEEVEPIQTPTSPTISGKNLFMKNKSKSSDTLPKFYTAAQMKEIPPTYRRQRRQGIHVVTSSSTDV